MDELTRTIIVSIISSVIAGGMSAAGAVIALRVEIRWLKQIIMTRPCIDRRTLPRNEVCNGD